MSLLALVPIVVVTVWLIYYWQSREFWKHINKIPGPPTLPLIGNGHQIGRNAAEIHKNMFRYWKEFGQGTFKMVTGPTATVLLTTPECIGTILSSTTLLEKHSAYKFAIPYFGSGLFTSNGQLYKTNRKMITPCFHFSILEEYFPSFNRTANTLAHKLSQFKEEQEFDMFSIASKFIIDGFCETALGIKDMDDKDIDGYEEAADSLGKIVHQRIFSTLSQFDWFFNLTDNGRKHKKYIKMADAFVNRALAVRREALKYEIHKVFAVDGEKTLKDGDSVTRKRLAFLDLLLLTKTAEGKPLDDDLILAETKTFVFAGHETSTSAISFILYVLSHHPEVQAAVYEEQMSVFGGHERDVTNDDLKAMPYLDRVIKESMRIYSVSPMIGRTINRELVLPDGHVLPAGTQVFMLLMCLHMNEESFPDPTKFDPDRFLPENMKKLHNYAYVPFSAGSRNCIGQKYSMLSVKTILSKLVRTFEYLPHAPGREPILEAALVLNSTNGVNMRIRKRITNYISANQSDTHHL